MTQTAVVVLTAAQQVVLVHWSHPPEEARPRARRRVIGFGLAAAVLIGLFFLVSTPKRESTAETTLLLNMENPRYAVYLCLYIGVCAVGQIEAVRLSLRYAKIVNRSWLRRGMWAVATGASLVLVYCAIRYTEIAGTHLGYDMTSWDPLYWIAGSFGALFQVFGWTVPSWGPRLSGAWRWMVNYRAYQRLRPLWWALYQATPAIALSDPPSRPADLVPRRGLEYRLYRRVIEIRDGQLALRFFMDPPAVRREAEAQGLSEDRTPAACEALLIRSALRARRGASAPATDSSSGDDSFTFAPDLQGDLAREIDWLIEVSREFTRLPSLEEPDDGSARRAAPRPGSRPDDAELDRPGR
jgi:hypothetical protein